jgi:transposase
VGWEKNNRKRSKRPFCPFKKFCVFLNGEQPETVLAERDYLSGRVDELEFAIDLSNRQFQKLQARVKELEEEKSHLESELSEALQAPFNKCKKKESPENPKKRGAPVGHPGWFRKKPDHIDKTIDVFLDLCPHCGNKDISPCNHTTEHIQEDLEDGKVIVTRFVHLYFWCPHCKKAVHGWGENEIPNAFIGPEAKAKASFLRHEIKVSYNDVPRALFHLCGLPLSPGAVVGFDHKFREKGQPLYLALKQSLSQTPYIHADETGWKDDWLWIFTNPYITFFHIDKSRGSKVVIDHLGKSYGGTLITDFWNAYRNKVEAFAKQKCLRHILGDIKELLDKELSKQKGKHPNAEVFLQDVKDLFKDAISLHNQHPALAPNEYRSSRKDILKRFRKLYRHEPLSHHKSDNIRKRLIKFQDELFVFLEYPGTILPTNNFAERGIRPCVLFRKISFGNMTRNGQKSIALIMTIIKTAKLRRLDPIKVLRNIMANGVTPEILAQFELSSAMPEAP